MEMSEAAKEARRQYEREYYKKHPEKARKKLQRYWEKKGKNIRAEKNEREIRRTTSAIAFSNELVSELNNAIDRVGHIIGEAKLSIVILDQRNEGNEISAIPVYISREDINYLESAIKVMKYMLLNYEPQ